MSEQRREISLSLGTGLLLIGLSTNQCNMVRQLGRIADTADLQLCIEAIKAGVDPATLSKPCNDLRKVSR
jgi:hypothetical protein